LTTKKSCSSSATIWI